MKRVSFRYEKDGEEKDAYVDIDERTAAVLDEIEDEEIVNMYLKDEYILSRKEKEYQKNKEKGIFDEFDSYILIDDDIDSCDRYIKDEMIEKLRKSYMVLSRNQKDLISKIYYEGKSINEVAKETGVSKSTIKSKLRHIYEKLRKELIK